MPVIARDVQACDPGARVGVQQAAAAVGGDELPDDLCVPMLTSDVKARKTVDVSLRHHELCDDMPFGFEKHPDDFDVALLTGNEQARATLMATIEQAVAFRHNLELPHYFFVAVLTCYIQAVDIFEVCFLHKYSAY